MVESDSLGNRAIIDRTPLFPADGSQWSSLANLNHHTDVHMEKIVIGSRPIFLTFPWFMTIEPLYNFYYRIKSYIKRGSNLTWG